MSQEPPPGWSPQQPPPFGAPPGPPLPPESGWAPPPPAPQPGVVPLRPLRMGEIMSGAIEYVRRYPRAVISISAAVGVAAAFVQLAFLGFSAGDLDDVLTSDPATLTPEQLLDLLITLGTLTAISGAVAGVLQVLGTGMLAHVMGRAVIGRATTAGEAWTLVRPQILRLLAATILVSVLVSVAIGLPLAPGAALLAMGATESGALALLTGSVAALALGVWVSFSLILTTVSLALEDCGPITAMKRSWRLVRGGFWRTLGIVLVGSIVGQAVGSIAAVPFSLVGSASGELTTAATFATAMAGMVTVLVALPFVAGVTTLVYIDRRMRVEGLATTLNASAEPAV